MLGCLRGLIFRTKVRNHELQLNIYPFSDASLPARGHINIPLPKGR